MADVAAEPSPPDAPSYYTPQQAQGWAAGWVAGYQAASDLAEKAEAECDRLLYQLQLANAEILEQTEWKV